MTLRSHLWLRILKHNIEAWWIKRTYRESAYDRWMRTTTTYPYQNRTEELEKYCNR